MKKLLFAFALSAFLYSCESDENAGNNNIPNDTTEVEQKTVPENNDATIELTDEEINSKSEELERKSEDINKELDNLIENL